MPDMQTAHLPEVGRLSIHDEFGQVAGTKNHIATLKSLLLTTFGGGTCPELPPLSEH